ncbi:protease PrsW [Insulibacter thermoxylanivorax]|uniref:Protease PrsW n=1 Tax=Insulibacter thermoxylanivorax TaxID=2749268 RepID=A0A916VE50_9BACL|nr:glutamic-type intramembrane protease PrsW [Insulibacter thermoxylanivorax]GFR36862.1 protease PrsW [Insulibacter thermoxylanivorax]
MWVSLIVAAVTPGFSLLTYFYLKDRYDAEPVRNVARFFVIGLLLVFPTMFIQRGLVLWLGESPFVFSFVISGGVEEFVKWFIIFFIAFNQTFFNEPYDGVVYTVAVSLGFATLENVLYAIVLQTDPMSLLVRALLPVSGHALFGVIMGFCFGKAKFSDKPGYLRKSLLWPIVAHGIFDFIQMAFPSSWTWTIVPFVALLWICSMILVRKSLEKSPFRYVFRDDMINITGNGQ